MLSRSKMMRCLVILLVPLVAGTVFGFIVWSFLPGPFKADYQRITNGMELNQVEAIMGGPGQEIPSNRMPGFSRPRSGAPPGWLGVVWGERCFEWRISHYQPGRPPPVLWPRYEGTETIYIGITDGKVVSKYYMKDAL